ncbi:MAG: ribonuclease E/G [Alphaproteobacteria bacterium]|nr:ribonuclease E/G [Alphaproteobacteria bacterium]
MMKRMLIDATHPEEIRVAVVDAHNRIEEFDFETATKKSLKGNIYLAKITRVEPSLQAAFIEYGGNRNGFLPFTVIHPDYFCIPIHDRSKLEDKMDLQTLEPADDLNLNFNENEDVQTEITAPNLSANTLDDHTTDDQKTSNENNELNSTKLNTGVETLGGEGPEEDDDTDSPRQPSFHRRYKIQEVIQRNQIILVQVTKEERGSKGAALTTYLSLAGRYCVLMPNSPRSGGISRKISSPTDRKRLRTIIDELNLPEGMSLIVRTAGKERGKLEVKRDAEYLFRTWDNIRDLTFKSIAPALTYEEASLIKRSIRDVYDKDIQEILVEGDEAFRSAKNFMKDLIPSHSKRIHRYTHPEISLFHAFGIEPQIDEIHLPTVQLPSGGYLVINPTEALVSIDVNSGRATRERHIEETALRTNLEATDEIARQLRLRDLAGLVVIDFIDMDDPRHNSAVERRLKDAMQRDRARIQIGTISAFGLLEMSRQRLRPSILESSTNTCHYCQGSGLMRSKESSALEILRVLEDESITQKSKLFTVSVPTEVGLYILNQKRNKLVDIELRHKIQVIIQIKNTLIPPQFEISYEDDNNKTIEIASSTKKPLSKFPSKSRSPLPRHPDKRDSSTRVSRNGLQPRIPTTHEQVQPANDAEANPDNTEGQAPASDNVSRTRRRGRRGGRRRHSQQRLSYEEANFGSQENNPASDHQPPFGRIPNEDFRRRGSQPYGIANSASPGIKPPHKESQDSVEKQTSQRKSWWQRLLD